MAQLTPARALFVAYVIIICAVVAWCALYRPEDPPAPSLAASRLAMVEPPPLVAGTKHITASVAYVISMDPVREASLRKHFARLQLPPIVMLPGFTPEEAMASSFVQNGTLPMEAIGKSLSGPQAGAVVAFLNAFTRIARGEHEWVLLFEDDARAVNVHAGTNMMQYTLPEDAELVNLGRGANEVCLDTRELTYRQTWGGFLQHAFLVSRGGARKALQAMNPIRRVMDMVIHRASCAWTRAPNVYQSEEGVAEEDRIHGETVQRLEPCVMLYEPSVRVFEQTSNPTPPDFGPAKTCFEASVWVGEGGGGYAIHPLDWCATRSMV